MHLDASAHPVVHLHYGNPSERPGDADTLFAQFSQLLARDTPFVLVADGAPGRGEDKAADTAYRRQVSLWVKANREVLHRLVKGQVHIAADAEQAQMLRDFADTFVKFWGFPLFVVTDTAQAQSQAERLLAEIPHDDVTR